MTFPSRFGSKALVQIQGALARALGGSAPLPRSGATTCRALMMSPRRRHLQLPPSPPDASSTLSVALGNARLFCRARVPSASPRRSGYPAPALLRVVLMRSCVCCPLAIWGLSRFSEAQRPRERVSFAPSSPHRRKSSLTPFQSTRAPARFNLRSPTFCFLTLDCCCFKITPFTELLMSANTSPRLHREETGSER